jgi:4-aminobutyrate aminotransferase-like enzyme
VTATVEVSGRTSAANHVEIRGTGNAMNVLKIKPPLSFDQAAADFFADALESVLT